MKAWPLVIFSLSAGIGGAAITIPTEIVIEKNKPKPVVPEPTPTPYVDNVITCETKTNNLTITSSLSKYTENNYISTTLSITNNRGKDISDASITVIVRDNDLVKFKLGNIKANEVGSKPICKDDINTKLLSSGKKAIASGDTIKFLLVREGSFSVDANNRLLMEDSLGNFNYVNDTELEKLTGKFIVKDEINDDFETQEDFYTYVSLIQTGGEREIWLINGEYVLAQSAQVPLFTLKIHGLNNSQGNKTNHYLKVYKEDDPSYTQEEQLMWCENMNLYFDNLNVHAKNGQCSGLFTSYGIQCHLLECNNCYFTGTFCPRALNSKFTSCTFDGRFIYSNESGTWKARDCIVIYSNFYATFDKCTFLTCGKAIKVYAAGMDGPLNVNKCTFKRDMSLIQEEWAKYPEESRNLPACKPIVEMDTLTYSQSGKPAKVNITNPTIIDYPMEVGKVTLCHDDAGDKYYDSNGTFTLQDHHIITISGYKN